MKKYSIWLDGISDNSCESLDKDIEVDVLIIGGGITGLSTSYHLSKSELKVCIVEKNKLFHGVTAKTTGKLTYLQDNIYSKIKLYRGINAAKEYFDSQKFAIDLVKGIINNENIDCNFDKVSSFVFDEKNDAKINKEIRILNDLDVDLLFSRTLPDDKNINNGFYDENTYVFHPLKYLFEIRKICLNRNIQIYEHTKIESVDKVNDFYYCKANNNYIKARYVVLALHYPYFLKPFFMPFKSYLEKSYIKVLKVNNYYKYSAISISKPNLSIRYYNDNGNYYKFVLTNSHNLSVKNNDLLNFRTLLNKSENISNVWSNTDIITMDSLPYIGAIDKNKTLFIGTGYNTWGMTNGSLAGKIISDLILYNYNKYEELFNPKRVINLGNIINFPLVIGSNSYSFIKSKLSKNKYWYNNNIKIDSIGGKNVGIYTDENGNDHIVYTTCPHFKCDLQFNEIEKTWDCPCHGSRFDIDGNCIEGPSNYNISFVKSNK